MAAAQEEHRDSRPICSSASRTALELDALLEVVAQLAASDLGAARVRALSPASDLEEVEHRHALVGEVASLSSDGRLVAGIEEPIEPLLASVRPAIDEGREESEADDGTASAALRPSLGGREMLLLARALAEVLAAGERVERHAERSPLLAERVEAARTAGDPSPFVERVAEVLGPDGEVRDDASPLLQSLRSAVRSRREQVYEALGRYATTHRDELAEETLSLRDGRLTVLLPSGSRGRLPGLIHGRSGTGRSFYFEPLETVEANNDLQQAVDDEGAERRRLMGELRDLLDRGHAGIYAWLVLLGELDALAAIHRFGERSRGRLAELAPRGALRLVGARHPLLLPALEVERLAALGNAGHTGDVVPLDLALGEPRALVITGPNAGGKTVALKTLGLLAMANQCGLPVPVEAGTRLPAFEKVVAVVGDDQDLLMNRSTFSGRLLRLQEAWDRAGPDSLILLDEIGSGTNPEEGAALSIALLEGICEKGALAILVTHLTQLASAALELPAAGCAAMEFDSESALPTFRLRVGPPGGSEALALGRRLGLSERWLARADALLGSEHRELRGLLREVERSRDESRALEEQHRAALLDQEKLNQRLADEHNEARKQKAELRGRVQASLTTLRQEVRRRLDEESVRLAEGARASAAERQIKAPKASRSRAKVAESVARVLDVPEVSELEVLTEPEEPEAPARPPEVGDSVRHVSLGWCGTLEKIDGDRATVMAGGKTVRCRLEELALDGQPGAPLRGSVRTASARPKRAAGHKSRDSSSTEAPSELKLLGKRVDPALDELDGWLDRAMLAGMERGRVVHGFGTGALRRAVREHLRGHHAVKSFERAPQNQGGDGATLVTFRDI